MKILDKIYNKLKEDKGKLSKSKFSKNYLRKDRNYLFVVAYNKMEVSTDALLNLHCVLVDEGYNKLASEVLEEAVKLTRANLAVE
jgi:hypothetical protein